jgi:dephospho-CoA kinase
MRLWGVTGGIGMGKSTAGELLRRRKIPVADTDEIAHQLCEPGQPALAEIIQKFGSSILTPDGQLDRKRLASIVFADTTALKDLEAILHPRIRAEWGRRAAQWRQEGSEHGAVIIPLLFETEAAPLFDAVVCVACSEASQWRRLRERGWSDESIRNRLAAQWPIEQKIARANFVVWTDTTMEAHDAQWARLLA